jgi:hypothetical protein
MAATEATLAFLWRGSWPPHERPYCRKSPHLHNGLVSVMQRYRTGTTRNTGSGALTNRVYSTVMKEVCWEQSSGMILMLFSCRLTSRGTGLQWSVSLLCPFQLEPWPLVSLLCLTLMDWYRRLLISRKLLGCGPKHVLTRDIGLVSVSWEQSSPTQKSSGWLMPLNSAP